MNKGLDYDYMKKHLLDYSVMQIHQGYDPEDIKDALVSYGYNKKLIDDIYAAIRELRPKKKAHVSKNQITKDLYYYIQNLLVDFISKEVDHGYDLEVIRKALVNYGHHRDMVDSAIQAYETGEVLEYEKPTLIRFPQQLLFAVSLILILIGIVLLSISTNTIILKVLLAFFPAILGIILANIAKMSIRAKSFEKFIPVFTMLFVIVAFYILINFSTTLQELNNLEYIIILNVLIAFIFSSIICIFSKDESEEIIALKEDSEMESDREAKVEKIEKIDNGLELHSEQNGRKQGPNRQNHPSASGPNPGKGSQGSPHSEKESASKAHAHPEIEMNEKNAQKMFPPPTNLPFPEEGKA